MCKMCVLRNSMRCMGIPVHACVESVQKCVVASVLALVCMRVTLVKLVDVGVVEAGSRAHVVKCNDAKT